MKRIYFTLLCFLQMPVFLSAQEHRLPVNGRIEFEKTANMYAIIRKNFDVDQDRFMQQAFDSYKKDHPRFRKLHSILLFADNKTLYKPLPDSLPQGFFNQSFLAEQNNTILTDLLGHTYVCQKSVYDENFLVKDTVRSIQWKITNEMREIAGYHCRRANAIIMDSIYVVAFYTDQIHVSGGPESFAGLPGIILGVALPHDNVTWFATSVSFGAVLATALVAPQKGKVVSVKALQTNLAPILQLKDKFWWWVLL